MVLVEIYKETVKNFKTYITLRRILLTLSHPGKLEPNCFEVFPGDLVSYPL